MTAGFNQVLKLTQPVSDRAGFKSSSPHNPTAGFAYFIPFQKGTSQGILLFYLLGALTQSWIGVSAF